MTRQPARPPPLDHGVIGNGRVLALVSPSSAVEWLCAPRFDSPSVFGRILDAERGGTFRLLFGGVECKGAMSYVANTNVLRTVFTQGPDSWEVLDFAPRTANGAQHLTPFQVIRVVRLLSGAPRLTVDFDPRPAYASVTPQFIERAGVLAVEGGPPGLRLSSNLPIAYILSRREFTLRGDVHFVLSIGDELATRPEADVYALLQGTIDGWRTWSKTCALPAFAAPEVLRSALCLKLHAYVDTGAIIAAATTSIPEAMGTERTWDYRYTWMRDAAFVVEALRRLSHLAEGEQFMGFLRDVAEAGPLRPLYGVGGETHIPESTLDYLSGFGGNGHVRVGNAAALQQQNDIYGELVLCLETLLTDPRLVNDDAETYFPLLEALVERAITLAPLPDTGIWEFRSMLRHYTFSRAMCWVAIARGARLARRLGRAALADKWERVADEERQVILTRGYNARLGFFTQALDGEHPDASLLLLPTLGILDGKDPRFLSTLDHYAERLVEHGLMLRYRNPDDFGETRSAFTVCSFWWAEALALAGRLDAAIEVFERVARCANPLGLFSEDVDPETGAMLGNFPQAYTHVGLIHAAITIGDLTAARDGRVRAWT